MVSVIPTPLAFLDADEELFFSDNFEFHHTILGKAPERLDSRTRICARLCATLCRRPFCQ